MSYTLLTKCRICGNTDLKPVFDLGLQPLANNFVKPCEPRQGHYPLKVLLCPTCSLSQLSVTVDPAVLYKNYSYVTSTSQMMHNHFEHLISIFTSENAFAKGVLEIGSNDGAFLRAMSPHTFSSVIGIDPAENLVVGNAICGMFNRTTAMEAMRLLGSYPSLVVARHCVAHMDDLRGFVDTLKIVGGPNTLIAIEIPYMRDTLNRVEFDQIYHEHLNFISLHSIEHLLKGSPFHIHRVIHYAIHGGTVLVLLRHGGSQIEPTVSEYVREDKTTVEDWRIFNIKAHEKIDNMACAIRGRADSGDVVCGFGASAKASVWIHATGMAHKISFVTDNSPFKPGCNMPGTMIPVMPQETLEDADYAILFAWNFRDEILESQKAWRVGGGRFLIPTATGVEIV